MGLHSHSESRELHQGFSWLIPQLKLALTAYLVAWLKLGPEGGLDFIQLRCYNALRCTVEERPQNSRRGSRGSKRQVLEGHLTGLTCIASSPNYGT